MSQHGYYRTPAIHGDRVIFVCEDDLWEVPAAGGVARRLTSGLGQMLAPAFSPDGERIALSAEEEGHSEVYVMPSRGGRLERLTFDDDAAQVIGWSEDGVSVIFSSGRHSAHRNQELFSVPASGGLPRSLGVGEGVWFWQQPGGAGRVLGRHRADLARWKRYRGGLAGELWIDAAGEDRWQHLFSETPGGFIRPIWIGERVYYVSDVEGHGNLYSCLTDGSDIRRHTHHEGFYVRGTQSDGARIVYACGADLYLFDPSLDESIKIAIDLASPRTQLQRKFVDAADYLESYALHPRGHYLAITSRGKPFNFGLWEGAVRQTGAEHGVRYRLADYLFDGEHLVVLSDEGSHDAGRPGEHLELHLPSGERTGRVPCEVDLGRAVELKPSPVARQVLLANHRNELWWVDLESGEARLVDKSDHGWIDGFDWSPDGRWVAYGKPSSSLTAQLMLFDLEGQEHHALTSGEFRDGSPCFDPRGRYLYFVSYREFNPIYGNLFFELGLTRGQRLCLITLQEELPSPFVPTPRPLSEDKDEEEDEDEDEGREEDEETSGDEGEGEGEEEAPPEKPRQKPVRIDLEGIAQRVLVFPFGESVIEQIGATAERVYLLTSTPRGALGQQEEKKETVAGVLRFWSLRDRKLKTFSPDVEGFTLSQDRKTLALATEEDLRVLSSQAPPPDDEEEEDEESTRETGWIDLGRVSVEVDPVAEWHQMFGEVWRLMRDHFWREDMSGVDWREVHDRYASLLPRLGTRAEFSDLIWTMQGELGTSHAYEYGGDYRRPPHYGLGHLGAELLWDEERGAYRIAHILRGDDWDPKRGSPLAAPGVRVREGDLLISIDGKRLTRERSPGEKLINKAGQEIELLIKSPEDEESRTVTVRAMGSEHALRYREWVQTRRALVHRLGEGRVGYVHVPDMGPQGYAEFHRGYMSERGKEALVVDVRFNGGGHVSALILEKLTRRPVGYDLPRHGKPMPYPAEGPSGPLVALTNEYAGSDGDIFSHGFKLMGLGPLLGKRTWGGVIGIWPRHALVDGSVTTQPEFSFWFHDVGFGVENYGTEPDTLIEDPPQAQAEGDDVQLEAAVHKALELLAHGNFAPPADFSPYPNLAPGKLQR